MLEVDRLFLTFWCFDQETICMNYFCHFFSIDTALDFFCPGEGEVRRGALCVDGGALKFNGVHVGNVGLLLHRTS